MRCSRTVRSFLTLTLAVWAPAASALTVGDLVEGDLLITEVMKDPEMVADTAGEWFEVYNASGDSVDLNGLVVYDLGTNTFTVSTSVVIAADDYAVFAINKNSSTNGGIPAVDVRFTSTQMRLADDDQVYLSNGTTVIDAVAWDTSTFPSTPGEALVLDADFADSASNDDGINWCSAFDATYGLGDKGTPGSANDDCDTQPLDRHVAGDLVITELMFDPAAVADYNGEWFEVYNASNWVMDLEGLVVADLGTDSFTVAGSLSVLPGGYLVFAATDSASNGGIPVVDYDFPTSTFRLDNGVDEVELSYGTVVFDTVAYDDSSFPATAGASATLEPALFDATSNDDGGNWCAAETAYGAGDLGTPGSANDACFDDADGDGYSTAVDCDDADTSIHPGASETQDLVDEDCDGLVDEDFLSAGDISITEFMNNPLRTSDTYGEWFEVYNASSFDIDLIGWTVSGEDVGSFTVETSLVVAPGAWAVFGASGDTASNGGVTVDYDYDRQDFKLHNFTDSIILSAGSFVVDRVDYETGWPLGNGKSTALDPDYSGQSLGGDPDPWCLSSTRLPGNNDKGTPGAVNEGCAISTLDDLVEGELVITEIMANPKVVADYRGEWFEVHNTTDMMLDITGLEVTGTDGDSFVVDLPSFIPAGGYGVLAIEDTASLNGGLPVVDFAFDSADFRLDDEVGDDITLTFGGLTFDEVIYDVLEFPDPNGKSISLDPDQTDATLNDDPGAWSTGVTAYGDGDMGTPGAQNDPFCFDGFADAGLNGGVWTTLEGSPTTGDPDYMLGLSCTWDGTDYSATEVETVDTIQYGMVRFEGGFSNTWAADPDEVTGLFMGLRTVVGACEYAIGIENGTLSMVNDLDCDGSIAADEACAIAIPNWTTWAAATPAWTLTWSDQGGGVTAVDLDVAGTPEVSVQDGDGQCDPAFLIPTTPMSVNLRCDLAPSTAFSAGDLNVDAISVVPDSGTCPL